MELTFVTREVRGLAAMCVVGALIASGWNFALGLAPGLTLRLVDVCAAAAGVCVVIAGLAGWRPRLDPTASLILASLAALCLAEGVAQLTSGFPPRDPVLAIRLGYFVVLALSAVLAFSNHRNPGLILRWITIAGVLQAILVVGQYAAFLSFGTTGAAGVDLAVKMAHLRDPDSPLWWVGGVVRPSGSFGHPNGAGAFVAVAFLASLAWPLNASGTRARLVRFIPSALLAAAAVVTGSRGALLIMSLPALMLLIGKNQSAWSRATYVAATASIVALALLANSPGAPHLERPLPGNQREAGPLKRTLTRVGSLLQPSRLQTAQGRLATWAEGARLVSQYPEGIGLSRTLGVLRSGSGVGATHNSFLLLSAALGLPVGLAFVGLCTLGLWRYAMRALKSAQDAVLWRSALMTMTAFALSLFLEDRVQDVTSLLGPAALLGLVLGPGRLAVRTL